MNVLVVGQGGREHAIVRALRQSVSSVENVHALPGSDGIAQDAKCHAVEWSDFEKVLGVIQSERIELVVIGPEIPLEGGLSDFLRSKNIRVMGPSREAARLESSKIFSKEFMVSAGVPTARHFVVSSVHETLANAAAFNAPYVLKADGLAAGKGVFICADLNELSQAAHSIFEDRSLGDAGSRALLEEFTSGFEISYLILTNGRDYASLPLAQDHKRLRDEDRGPNTGGMGVVAPIPIAPSLHEEIIAKVVAPSVAELGRRNYVFNGVLFIGLMMTDQGPSVLEYNTRFGDPETQALLPLLDGEWGSVLKSLADGKVETLKWKPLSSACVVLSAKGYPETPLKGGRIYLPAATNEQRRYLLHAGSKRIDGEWTTSGGRVLNAVGIGPTLRDAIESAYELAREVKSESLFFRKDIGRRQLR
jgi:phosphoribosylamine--glycine ligase